MFQFMSRQTTSSEQERSENEISNSIFQAGVVFASLTTQTFQTEPFAVLKLYVSDEELKEKYINKAKEHNDNMLSNRYPDSGFDLFVSQIEKFTDQHSSKMIDFKIKTEMLYSRDGSKEVNDWTSCGYYLYPRSSMSKTPLMLANHTGIIDAGYRGFIKGAFRHLSPLSSEQYYLVDKHARLVQVCHPSLCPVLVSVVNSETDLSDTSRGDGGFGSTGK